MTAHAPLAAGRRHTVGRLPNGRVVAVGADSAGECRVSQWRDVVAVATGSHHSVGLRTDGGVVATGSNSYGQLEVGAWPSS